ncbi:hypothetical protein BDZ89DRAFT_1054432 [Hymenopellis radicata]|nr:hypothetical protein BDZ89DRAFT_1054432 [Hymenopellis radicata]
MHLDVSKGHSTRASDKTDKLNRSIFRPAITFNKDAKRRIQECYEEERSEHERAMRDIRDTQTRRALLSGIHAPVSSGGVGKTILTGQSDFPDVDKARARPREQESEDDIGNRPTKKVKGKGKAPVEGSDGPKQQKFRSCLWWDVQMRMVPDLELTRQFELVLASTSAGTWKYSNGREKIR